MIKKGFICLCVFLMCLVTPVYGEELKLAPNAGASLLMEASSRQDVYKRQVLQSITSAYTEWAYRIFCSVV